MKKHKNTFGITGSESAINYFAELAVKDGWVFNEVDGYSFNNLSFAGKSFSENNDANIKVGEFFYCEIKDTDTSDSPVINISTPEGFSKALTLMQEVEEEQLYGECIKSPNRDFTKGRIYKISGFSMFIDEKIYTIESDDTGRDNTCNADYFKLVPESEYLAQQERENQIKQVQDFGWKNEQEVKYDFICPHSKNKFKKGDKYWFIEAFTLDNAAMQGPDILPQGYSCFAYFHNESDALAWNEAKFGEKEEVKEVLCKNSENETLLSVTQNGENYEIKVKKGIKINLTVE
jgi:hypothetical protein